MGQRTWGPVWNASGKVWFSNLHPYFPLPTLPPTPHSFHPASVGIVTVSFTNASGRRPGLSGVSVRRKNKPPTLPLFLFSSSSSLDLVHRDQLLPGSIPEPPCGCTLTAAHICDHHAPAEGLQRAGQPGCRLGPAASKVPPVSETQTLGHQALETKAQSLATGVKSPENPGPGEPSPHCPGLG